MPEIALTELAAAIADGQPIDWSRVGTGIPPAGLAARARIVERIAQAHAALPPPTSFSSSLRDSLLNLSDETIVDADNPVTWGPLLIIEPIGHGTYGVVYRGLDRRLNREVALKLLRRKDRRESAVIEEGGLMAQVRHPNVVTVYGAERIDGRVGVWMEFVKGRTLEQLLRAQGPFSSFEAALIGRELCRALSAVHQAGLLHRDVKAQNVMREDGGRIILMDFGMGSELRAEESAPGLAGTPLYMAPGTLAGNPPTTASDLYAVGVLLFHLVTGSFPVEGRTLAELRAAHAATARKHLRPEIDSLFAAVVERALIPDPARRFESAGQMERELGLLLARTAAPSSRSRIVWGAIGMTIALTGVAVIGLSFGRPPASQGTEGPEDVTVTTASRRARELFAEAVVLHKHGQAGPAAALYESALRHDPQFASAHVNLAWALRDLGRLESDYRQHVDRAVTLAPAATDTERLYIQATDQHVRGDLDSACSSYEALLRLDPAHPFAFANLRGLYLRLNRPERIFDLALARARSLPDDFLAQANAAQQLVMRGDLARARPWAEAARALITPELRASGEQAAPWLEMLPLHERWLANDVDVLRHGLDALTRTLPARRDLERDTYAQMIMTMYLALGRLHDADDVTLHMPGKERRQGHLVLAALFADDRETARGRLRQLPVELFFERPAKLVQAGLIDEAKAALARHPSNLVAADPFLGVARGQIAFEEGRYREAIETLGPATSVLQRRPATAEYFFGMMTLASAWRAVGDTHQATTILEAASQQRAASFSPLGSAGARWLRARLALAREYRLQARYADADAVAEELRHLLKHADATHPILNALRSRALEH